MDFIKYEEKDNIAIVTINRPEALNALNSFVLDELKEVFASIDTDFIRAVIITGEGDKSFVAGADIGEMSELDSKEGESFGKKGNDIFRMIEEFPVPVIAAVNGFALGGGMELSMCCDIRLASENAVFAQPEVGLGITAGFGGTQRLPRLIGLGKAKELLYTTSKIDAKEAKQLGLVNEVYLKGDLMDEAIKMAQKIASCAPIAVRATKKAINDGIHKSMDDAIIIEEKLFGSCFESEDQKEAMKAFKEKRKVSEFKNR